jgi:hypothetical protein
VLHKELSRRKRSESSRKPRPPFFTLRCVRRSMKFGSDVPDGAEKRLNPAVLLRSVRSVESMSEVRGVRVLN